MERVKAWRGLLLPTRVGVKKTERERREREVEGGRESASGPSLFESVCARRPPAPAHQASPAHPRARRKGVKVGDACARAGARLHTVKREKEERKREKERERERESKGVAGPNLAFSCGSKEDDAIYFAHRFPLFAHKRRFLPTLIKKRRILPTFLYPPLRSLLRNVKNSSA